MVLPRHVLSITFALSRLARGIRGWPMTAMILGGTVIFNRFRPQSEDANSTVHTDCAVKHPLHVSLGYPGGSVTGLQFLAVFVSFDFFVRQC